MFTVVEAVKSKDSVLSIKPNPFVQLVSASLVLDCPSSTRTGRAVSEEKQDSS
jgi:hypothetical protein